MEIQATCRNRQVVEGDIDMSVKIIVSIEMYVADRLFLWFA